MIRQAAKTTSPHIPLEFHDDGRIAFASNRMVCFSGEAGSGKSYFARKLAMETFGQEPISMFSSPVTDISEFWGAWRLTGNETTFNEGLLSRALRSKGRTFLCEEFSLLPVEVRTAAFMGLRTERRVVNPMNGETLEVPDDFRIIFTTLRESLACRRSAESMRALMSGVVVIDVPPLRTAEVEAILSEKYPQAPSGLVAQAVELFDQYKTVGSDREERGGSTGLNIRHADHLVSLLMARMPLDRAVRIALVNAHILDEDRFQAAILKHSISASPSAPDTDGENGSDFETDADAKTENDRV